MVGCSLSSSQRLGQNELSYGLPYRGHLRHGSALEASANVTLARPRDSTRFGLKALTNALQKAGDDVTKAHPNSLKLKVGDLAAPRGGPHFRHHSHRSGRDVDVMFYLLDQSGQAVKDRAYAHDRFGIAVQEKSNSIRVFDTARNWSFVRSLLSNPTIDVQWIFVSAGVKAKLLNYASFVETDPSVLSKAMWVLHQPSNGRSHDDHFHVRIACGAHQRSLGCQDPEPFWPWWSDEQEKLSDAAPPLRDVDLWDFFGEDA